MSVGWDWALQDASNVTRYRAVAAATGVAGAGVTEDVAAVGPAGDELPQPARTTARIGRAKERVIRLLLDQENVNGFAGIPGRQLGVTMPCSRNELLGHSALDRLQPPIVIVSSHLSARGAEGLIPANGHFTRHMPWQRGAKQPLRHGRVPGTSRRQE